MKSIKLKRENVMLDRVGVTIYDFGNFKITESEYNSLREMIGEKLFRTSKDYPKNSNYSSILLENVSGKGYLRYNPKKQRCTLSLQLFINPTRLLNHSFVNSNIKRDSYDGKDNYIPYHLQLLYGIKNLQKRSSKLFALKIQSIIEEFTDCLEANVKSYSKSSYPKVSFSIIEIYWDMFCHTPFPYLNSVHQSWSTYFVKTRSPQISSPSISEGLEKNSRYFIGINRTKERFKLYTKAKNLIRHEAEFRKERIRSICKTTVLERPSIKSIHEFIEPLVLQAITVFNKIQPDKSSIHEEPKTFKPIYDIARICGYNSELFDSILNELHHNRRLVSRKILYPKKIKLLATGDWENPSKKIYIPSTKLLSLIDRLFQSPKN